MTTSNIRVIRYDINGQPHVFRFLRTPETDAIPDEELIAAIKAR